MPISLSNIKVTDGQNNLVITGNDITINGKSILGQNNYVTLDTNQTITGQKTFTTFPRVSNNSDDIAFMIKDTGLATNNTTPSANHFRSFRYFANDSSIVADLRLLSTTSGTSVAEILARRTINGSSYNSAISAIVNSNGNTYTSAPIPTSTTSTSSTQIATAGWVNTVGNNVVHLAGDETISGTKTFTDIIKIYSTKDTTVKLARSDLTRGTTPTSDNWSQVRMDDKNGDWIGFWGSCVTTSNDIRSQITARGINGTDASIICGVTANGNVWTYAPTPATVDNSSNIATTAYVNNKFQVVSALPSSPDSNTFYFIPA